MITGKLYLVPYGKPSKKGYPIKILITEGTTKEKKHFPLNQHSHEQYWNFDKVEPTIKHPEYDDVIDDVLFYKKKLIDALRLAKKNKWSVDQTIGYLETDQTKNDAEEDENNNSFFTYAENHIKGLLEIADELESKGEKFKANAKRNTAESKKYAVVSLKKHKKEVRFKDINQTLLKKYRDYNIATMTTNANGMHAHLSKLKSIYYEATGTTAPFKGVMPKIIKAKKKDITKEEMNLVVKHPFVDNGGFSGAYHFANYFLLCFYLGGIDLVDLANLKYKDHVLRGRIYYRRFKGNTEELINNRIFPIAKKILDQYKAHSKGYLVPIHQASSYTTFSRNYNRRIKIYFKRLKKEEGNNEIKFESYITSKSPRKTFNNIGRQIGINREIRQEILGHSPNDTHADYEEKFPEKIRDEAHLKIIQEIL